MVGCPLCGYPHSDETNRIGGRGVLAREAQQQPEQQAAEKQERQRKRLTWHGPDYSGKPAGAARPPGQAGGPLNPARRLRKLQAHTA